MNVKIEQGLDFINDNRRQLFFDAQEAKKEQMYSSSMNLAVSR